MKKSLFNRMSLVLIAVVLGVSLLASSAIACEKYIQEIRDYGDEDGIIEVGERIEFDIVIHTGNYMAGAGIAKNIRLYDRFGAELEVVYSKTYWVGEYKNDPLFYTKGKSEKVFLYWDIGTQDEGESATLYLTMART